MYLLLGIIVPRTLSAPPAVRDNAYLEAMLVHVRNLLEFFCLPCETQGEMRAQHYDDSLPPSELNRQLKRRLDNELHHLTLDRLERTDEKKKRWPPDTFVPFLHQCEAFLRLPGVGEKVKQAKLEDQVLAAQLTQICAEAVGKVPAKES